MKKFKGYVVNLIVIVCIILQSVTIFAAEVYNPPFQLSGVVKVVNGQSLEVYLPYINKQVTVMVNQDTMLINRIDKSKGKYVPEAIKVDDLVVIKGVLDKELFLGTEISYLSVSREKSRE